MIVSTQLVPVGFDAIAAWPFILVRPELRGNKGLIEHEFVHYREQAWITPLWWARYLLAPSFRQAAEVRAYKRQIAVGDLRAGVAAYYLTQYRTGLSFADALKLLA